MHKNHDQLIQQQESEEIKTLFDTALTLMMTKHMRIRKR
jgi:hypothetical protein